MKYRVRETIPVKPEQVVDVWLEEDIDGGVLLCIHGVDGHQWSVAYLSPDGRLCRSRFVGAGCGLQVDAGGRIVMGGE